jgi:hypothetical protein
LSLWLDKDRSVASCKMMGAAWLYMGTCMLPSGCLKVLNFGNFEQLCYDFTRVLLEVCCCCRCGDLLPAVCGGWCKVHSDPASW